MLKILASKPVVEMLVGTVETEQLPNPAAVEPVRNPTIISGSRANGVSKTMLTSTVSPAAHLVAAVLPYWIVCGLLIVPVAMPL